MIRFALIYFAIAGLGLLDHYRLTGLWFQWEQLFDGKLHHETIIAAFVITGAIMALGYSIRWITESILRRYKMKLLLSEEKIAIAYNKGRLVNQSLTFIAKAQLNHIFNLDAKTTSEVIVKLEAHLDKLFLKEMAK